MNIDLSRRTLLQGGAALAAGAVVSPFGTTGAFAKDEAVTWASLTPGFTVLITEYIRYHKLDEKNGFKLAKPTVYTSVPTYYGDFVAGNYEVCIGSWDSFALRYLKQVPIKLLCTITTAQMIGILASRKSNIKSVKDLAGKLVAAPQSTGTYRIARAVLKEMAGFNLEKQAKVQNVTNPAAAVSLLRAGSADAGLTWEPNVTNGLAADPDLQVVFDVGKAYKQKTGRDLPYFSVAIRDELLKKDPHIAAKVNSVFKDCINGILGDVDGAMKIVGERTGFDPAVLKRAIKSGRLDFKYASMADAGAQKTIGTAAEFFFKAGLLPKVPDGNFLVQS
jgi:NitT/TauT family transport system substrate-binding protein